LIEIKFYSKTKKSLLSNPLGDLRWRTHSVYSSLASPRSTSYSS